jgi:hypothetical protein
VKNKSLYAALNNRQKAIVQAGIAVIILCCLFPPWQYVSQAYGAIAKPAGYSFILSPPEPDNKECEFPVCGVGIDFSRLAIQFVIIVAVGALFLFSLSGQKQKRSDSDDVNAERKTTGRQPDEEIAEPERDRTRTLSCAGCGKGIEGTMKFCPYCKHPTGFPVQERRYQTQVSPVGKTVPIIPEAVDKPVKPERQSGLFRFLPVTSVLLLFLLCGLIAPRIFGASVGLLLLVWIPLSLYRIIRLRWPNSEITVVLFIAVPFLLTIDYRRGVTIENLFTIVFSYVVVRLLLYGRIKKKKSDLIMLKLPQA